MKIAVIGAGAMGSIYGGKLSKTNEVYLVVRKQPVADEINTNGVIIDENGESNVYHPHAVIDSREVGCVDLVILFVKATTSESALAGNTALIGPETRLMTLQNGAGHEDILGKFAAENRIVIGTTEDNGAVISPNHVRWGGVGNTNVGTVVPDEDGFLPKLKEAFDSCGFNVKIHENIQYLIWDKLFTNVSLSAVTGILQVDMGYIAGNAYAWEMTKALIHEAIVTAKAAGMEFDEEEITERVKNTSLNNPNGCTSIRADLRDGRKTEVNTISGAVVRAAAKYGVDVPSHKFVVNMVHAMEERA